MPSGSWTSGRLKNPKRPLALRWSWEAEASPAELALGGGEPGKLQRYVLTVRGDKVLLSAEGRQSPARPCGARRAIPAGLGKGWRRNSRVHESLCSRPVRRRLRKPFALCAHSDVSSQGFLNHQNLNSCARRAVLRGGT